MSPVRTSVAVRLDSGAPVSAGGLVLDWGTKVGDPVRADFARLLEGTPPTPEAVDFLILAASVYLADKVVLRRLASDRWGRTIELHVPQGDPGRWDLLRLGRFFHDLTGDNWTFRPYACQRAQERLAAQTPTLLGPAVSEVTLFSGGLDSFAWAAGRVSSLPLLVAHSDTTALGALQGVIGDRLVPNAPSRLRPFWLRLRRTGPLRDVEFESTTRSRSALFVAAAVALAQASGVAQVEVPENGFISLNPPMVPARSGTLSTRTTHPRIIASMNDLLAEAGIAVKVANPFLLRTKGDIARLAITSGAPDGLVFGTVSCARPSARRADPLRYGNCGYCFPCLVRRAGFQAAGANDLTVYRRDPRADLTMLHRGSGDDFKAVVTGLRRPFGPADLRASGPLPRGSDVHGLMDVLERSRAELRAMVEDGLSSSVRRAIGW